LEDFGNNVMNAETFDEAAVKWATFWIQLSDLLSPISSLFVIGLSVGFSTLFWVMTWFAGDPATIIAEREYPNTDMSFIAVIALGIYCYRLLFIFPRNPPRNTRS
jgi:hypothetical protein